MKKLLLLILENQRAILWALSYMNHGVHDVIGEQLNKTNDIIGPHITNK